LCCGRVRSTRLLADTKQPDGGKALLFTNTGTDFPVLTNSMGSTKRISIALGVENLCDVTDRLEDLFEDLKEPKKGFMEKISILPKLAALSGYFPSSYKGKVPVQEVVHKDPDLRILPVIKTWPYVQVLEMLECTVCRFLTGRQPVCTGTDTKPGQIIMKSIRLQDHLCR